MTEKDKKIKNEKNENDVDFVVVTTEFQGEFENQMRQWLDLGYGIANTFYIERTGQLPLYIAYLAKTNALDAVVSKLIHREELDTEGFI